MSKKATDISRRKFAKLSVLGIASMPLFSFRNELLKTADNSPKQLEIHLFSKHLQFLDYNEMSLAAATMGFDGLDLTVRRKGHVLPKNVSNDLPKAESAMKKHGLATTMMTTNVWDAHSLVNKNVLETASNLGFTHYRTNWLKYPEDKSIIESQALFGKQAKELEILNKKLGIIGGYQNHTGKNVGAPIWDLLPILGATKGKFIGSQYDIRHAVVEGGESWELGLKRIKPFINSIVIKDFKWGKVKGKWKPISVPMGEGMVNFKRYFSLLKKYQIHVPVSLHVEHDLGGAEKGKKKINITKKEVLLRIQKDLNYVREMWKNSI
ncbi:sugar phosphate isomerase/epimerase family protein [Polaribacter septentrionalilitoris]|uniref:sugar phosphate isomerase/epimerase family protein n=1 Tax=Polaribacter septentrionalilitoris TaxID=2494657 RepID=UPI0013591EF1|nr:TIM barrel protein [Polaribacter septentrionalilitoris]